MGIFYGDFVRNLENAINLTITQKHPRHWEEDHITHSILESWEKNKTIEIEGLSYPFSLKWDVKKLKGKHEKNFGDIAIIINLVMKNNEIIRGIGFLEAKKRDKDKLNFSAIKIPQLKRIKKNAPSSLVLLYDYDKITDIPHSLYDWDSLRCREYCFPNHLNFTQFTHCVVIPISLPIYKKDKTTSYYKFGIPFSYQIFFRYFHGLDLEYIESDSEIETLFNSVGYPTFIIQAGISRGIEGPRMPDLRQIQGQYQSIE